VEWGQSVWGTTGGGAVRLRRGRAGGSGGDTERGGDQAVSQRGSQAGTAGEAGRAGGQSGGDWGAGAVNPRPASRSGARDPCRQRVLVARQRSAGSGHASTAHANLGSLAWRQKHDHCPSPRRQRNICQSGGLHQSLTLIATLYQLGPAPWQSGNGFQICRDRLPKSTETGFVKPDAGSIGIAFTNLLSSAQ